MSHKKLLILILFTLAFWAGLFSYTQAATFADCPTTYGTIVCGAGEQYCGTCTTGIADNRSPQWTLNCGTCSWSCPAPNVTCGATCGPAYSGENPTCVTKKVTTDQCGNCTTTCRTAGDTYCSSTGTCLTPTACAGGSTWNGCACVANPYIIASPTSAQSAYINVTGNTTIGNDLYMTSSKALRVDGSGVTNFNLGNWGTGATGFTLNLNGGLNMSGNTITNTGRVQFKLNGPLDGVNAIETVNTDQDLIAYAQRNIYLVVDEQIEATPPQGLGDLIVTKDSQSGPPYLVVKNDGKVGIGTLTPGALFDATGQAMFGSSAELLGIGKNLIYGNISNSATAGNLLLLQKGGANRFVVDINGNATTTGHFSTTELCLNNDCKTAWPSGAGSGYWTQTGDNLYPTNINSQVGIGTTNPSVYTLLVNNTTNGWPVLFKTNTANGSNVLIRVNHLLASADPRISFGNDDPNPNPLGKNFWNMGMDNSDSDKFKISTDANSQLDLSTKLTIDYASGNVGIGTATPNSMLHVYKTSGTNAEIDIESTAGNHWGIYQERSNGDLRFWNSNNRVIFTSSGDVGIGTTLPSSKLDVSSTGNTSITVRSTDDNAALIVSANTGNTGTFGDKDPVIQFNSANNFRSEIRYDETANVLKFGTVSDGTQFSINALGNIGIGTLNPGTKLDVQGQSMFGSASQVVASGQNLIYGNVDTTSAGNLLLLQTESVDRFKVDKNGNATTTGHFATTELCLNNDCKTAWPAGGTGYWTATGNDISNSNSGNVNVGVPFALGTGKFNVNGNAVLNGSLLFPSNIDGTVQVMSLIGAGNGRSLNLNAANAGSSGNGGSVYINPGIGSGGTNGNVVLARSAGNVGIGIDNPDESLYVYRDATSPKDAQIKLYTNYGAGSNPWSIYYLGDNDPATVGYDDRGDLRFWTGNNRVVFTHDGAVVAGGLTPSQPRPGGGQWKFWSEGDIGINGSVYAYGGNFYVSGADVAEEFESDKELAEGTVVIMGDGGYKSVKPSNKAYDQMVIGVVSDDAGIVMGHISEDNKAQIAMVGVVGVKVTNENGAIKKGDLLVTSSLSGYAMKSTKNIVGTVIGKSLQDFDGYKGNIKALINLQ